MAHGGGKRATSCFSDVTNVYALEADGMPAVQAAAHGNCSSNCSETRLQCLLVLVSFSVRWLTCSPVLLQGAASACGQVSSAGLLPVRQLNQLLAQLCHAQQPR